MKGAEAANHQDSQEHLVELPARKVEPCVEEKQLGVGPKSIRAEHLSTKESKHSDTIGGREKKQQLSESTEGFST